MNTKKSKPRVRLHLRLPQPEKAEVCIRLNSYDQEGRFKSSPHIANATFVVLENVVPVIDEQKRQKVEKGLTGKTPHAFLEGDLVGWSGTFNGNARPQHKERLGSYRKPSLSLDGEVLNLLKKGRQIKYNPKKLKVFYSDQAEGKPAREKFNRAAQMVVVGWAFAVDGAASFSPVADNDEVLHAVPASTTEAADIPKGFAATRKRLAQLGLS